MAGDFKLFLWLDRSNNVANRDARELKIEICLIFSKRCLRDR